MEAQDNKKSLASIVGKNENMPDIANHIYLKKPNEADVKWAKDKIAHLDPQYNIELTAYEVGLIQGALITTSQEIPENKKLLQRLSNKIDIQFNLQVTCQANTILGKDEAL